MQSKIRPALVSFLSIAALLAIISLAACSYYEPQPDDPNKPRRLNVSKPDEKGAVVPAYQSGTYTSVWVGRFLDLEPAQRMVSQLHTRGLTSFTIKKTLVETGLVRAHDEVGDFYMVMAGLFGNQSEADILGQRLKAQGIVAGYETVGVDDPGEVEQEGTQTRQRVMNAQKVSQSAQQKASKPLPYDSPALTGEAFKKVVYGRYMGSFADPWEAQKEAEVLTRAGWPASVEKEKDGKGQQWFRVYLSPPVDRREWSADEKTLKAAKHSAASQPGIVILIDPSSLKGQVADINPDSDRSNASACAGFSEAGRLRVSIERVIGYIPESFFLAAIIDITPKDTGLIDYVVTKTSDFIHSTDTLSQGKALYGPSIYNRPEMENSLTKLVLNDSGGGLSAGFKKAETALTSIPGEKILLVYSEFQNLDQDQEIKSAFSSLKGSASGLRAFFIYGDTAERGYKLANDLAQLAGTSQAWDGCMLLQNNSYFEKFIKTIFR